MKMIRNRKTQTKMTQKTSFLFLGILAGTMTAMISGCGNNAAANSAKNTSTTAAKSVTESVASVEKGGYLTIPISDLSQTASFYKADLDGTEVEIVALKDSKGNLRTAFNACQVCYSSGRGYYRQDGEYLVCQNCGNSFTIDQVGIASGGCNPWPILDSDRTVTDDEIQISYDVLKSTADELPNFFQ